jgi:hypothetical protein
LLVGWLVGRSDHHGHHGRSQSHGNHAAGQSGAHDIPRPYNTLPAPILNAMTVLRAEIHASLTLYTLDKIRQSLRLGPAGGVDLREDTLGVVVQQVSCALCVVRVVRRVLTADCFGAG